MLDYNLPDFLCSWAQAELKSCARYIYIGLSIRSLLSSSDMRFDYILICKSVGRGEEQEGQKENGFENKVSLI